MREALLELLASDPFVPFRITLSSGQSYDVRFSDLLVVGKDVIDFYYPHSDLKSVLRLTQVASLDIIE